MTITLLTHRLVRIAIAAVAVALAVTTTVSAQQEATYEVVSSFTLLFDAGRRPSSLRQDSDGTFYGTARNGGMFDQGVLFRLERGAPGVVTTLRFFGGGDGVGPFGLVRALDGRFYGLTSGFGTVFRFDPPDGLTTLHTFSETDGVPVDLFAASDGNVYGLTEGGGDFGNGTIFVIDSSGHVRAIHSIPLSAGTGMTSLVKGSDGRFCVTARLGGGDGFGAEFGTAFTIDGAGTLTVLHSFAGREQGDGEGPVGLIQARDGRLYGTTRSGGQFGNGTVYSIDLTGHYRVLHSFSSSIDGSEPGPDLLEASDGNLYGVTQSGLLFMIDSSGTLTTVRHLGAFSPGELIQGADGRLYGPTEAGGLDGGGTIITMDLAGTLTTLYEFRIGGGAAAPGRPNGVIQARNGQFYGTTVINGSRRTGTVFAMDAAGSRTTLHNFQQDLASSGTSDGTPMSNLFEGADGSLYGTTFNDNEPFVSPGQLFKIGPAGDFTTATTAYRMRAGVIQARDGRLYFTTSIGERSSIPDTHGDILRVEANGTGRTLLHHFDGIESSNPLAELAEIDDGTLYGTTQGFGRPGGPQPDGTIFQIDPPTGMFTTRYSFSGPDGSSPQGRLIQGTDGLIYGTTSAGGAFGRGTVFSFDAAGALTTLHHFAGADGANPNAGVIQGLDGRLYGTTTNGGVFGRGTVFAMTAIGGLTLHDFALSDGANPVNELIQASDGAFYGAASSGGPTGGGVIFRVRLATSKPDGYFEIVSRSSGKCLDVFGASTDAGAPAIQWTCHGGPNQQWRLEPAGGVAVRIIARHSGQALDVFGASLDDVAPIIQWPVHGGDNQAWTLEPASDGYVRLVARHSGKAMDVEFASADDGARVIQYTPHGGANQQWLVRKVESTEPER